MMAKYKDIPNVLDECLKNVEGENCYAYIRSALCDLFYCAELTESEMETICYIVSLHYGDRG